MAGDDAPRAVFPTLVGRPRHMVCLMLQVIKAGYEGHAFMFMGSEVTG